MLLNLWYTAWLESASDVIFFHPGASLPNNK